MCVYMYIKLADLSKLIKPSGAKVSESKPAGACADGRVCVDVSTPLHIQNHHLTA